MLGFLVFNLRIIGKQRTVFLGDHGSNFIGFVVAWIAIHCSQNSIYEVAPITTVWFVAIPLLDCIGLIISRTLRGVSWAQLTPLKVLDIMSPMQSKRGIATNHTVVIGATS